MDSMLARAGVDDEGKELTGPTQVCCSQTMYMCVVKGLKLSFDF